MERVGGGSGGRLWVLAGSWGGSNGAGGGYGRRGSRGQGLEARGCLSADG